jgi:hypothetical protein
MALSLSAVHVSTCFLRIQLIISGKARLLSHCGQYGNLYANLYGYSMLLILMRYQNYTESMEWFCMVFSTLQV